MSTVLNCHLRLNLSAIILLLLLDIRFSGFNLLMQHQRPLLAGAEDIGSWQPILEFVSTTGVITNAGLIVFTMTVLPENIITQHGKLWIFVGFQVPIV